MPPRTGTPGTQQRRTRDTAGAASNEAWPPHAPPRLGGAAARTPASAANPPSNTNYTKRPGQKPHKQTVNNLRTTPLGQVVCAGGIHRARPLAALPAQLPAVLWVAAHDSRPASYPANVACNSPDTVPHRATILLELQRLRTLLKVHPIELHAKLLRARASCLRSSPRTWTRWHARGPAIAGAGP